jgi:hypothetical protein
MTHQHSPLQGLLPAATLWERSKNYKHLFGSRAKFSSKLEMEITKNQD